MDVSRQLFERAHRFESRFVLGHSLEGECEQVEGRRQALADTRPEAAARLVQGDESRELSIEREPANRENSSLLRGSYPKQLHVVVRLRAEISHCRAEVQSPADRRGQMIDSYRERRPGYRVADRIQSLGDQLAP